MMIDHANIAHGTPAAYREFIHEMLAGAQIQADLGMTYATLGDDVALEYTLRRFLAYTRAAATAFKDLKAMKEVDHA
jgi:hypothetical protein